MGLGIQDTEIACTEIIRDGIPGLSGTELR